ncbi:MAG: hypothetical protein F6K19_35685 [Cyanothece sp. SIO1E1]|nr:hypothetical protein [Cyanothece sp. SIO1E1]
MPYLLSTFTRTGHGGLPQRPDRPQITYTLGTVQPLPIAEHTSTKPLIIEPQGVYQLADGRLVMSRECDEIE